MKRAGLTEAMRVAAFLAACSLLGCGGSGEAINPGGGDAGSPSTVVDVPLGELRGVVRLAGAAPVWNADPCAAGEGDPQTDSGVANHDHGACARYRSLVVSAGNAVRWAVVSVEGVPPPAAGPCQPAVLDLVGLEFVPHVAALRVGEELIIRNGDDVLHTVHVSVGPITVLNEAMPVYRTESRHIFSEPGAYRVVCNVHAHMAAYVYVYPTNAVASVTDQAGWFQLAGLPPGEHVLQLWHERSGSRRTSLLVAPAATDAVELPLTISESPGAETESDDHSTHDHQEPDLPVAR